MFSFVPRDFSKWRFCGSRESKSQTTEAGLWLDLEVRYAEPSGKEQGFEARAAVACDKSEATNRSSSG